MARQHSLRLVPSVIRNLNIVSYLFKFKKTCMRLFLHLAIMWNMWKNSKPHNSIYLNGTWRQQRKRRGNESLAPKGKDKLNILTNALQQLHLHCSGIVLLLDCQGLLLLRMVLLRDGRRGHWCVRDIHCWVPTWRPIFPLDGFHMFLLRGGGCRHRGVGDVRCWAWWRCCALTSMLPLPHSTTPE